MEKTAAPARPAVDWGDRRVRSVAWLTLGLAGLQTAVGAANALLLDSSLLDPNDEASVFQPVNAAVTAAAGAAAAVRAARGPHQRARYALLAVVLVAFAADDMLVVHERIGEAVGAGLLGLPDHLAVRMWVVLLLPLLAAAFLVLVVEAARLRGGVGLLLASGLAALVAAVGVEVAGAVTRDPAFIERVGGKPETLRLLVEEGLELGGWVLVAGALWISIALPERPRAAPTEREPRHPVR